MEYLSEEHVKLLLTKEWLVKTDSELSTPYLLKFYASTIDIYCCVLITDTKSVWAEVLSNNRFARRWRDCNPQQSSELAGGSSEAEESWRIKCLEFIIAVHSLGGFAEMSFELAKTNYSDFAFTLDNGSFQWRWETLNVGPRMSADILSKHLIIPLISITHLAFSSADPVGTSSEHELEKSVDKVGRAARRTLDTHIRNALSRPLLATTLRRITAMFNFVPDLPRIVVDTVAPDLTPPSPPASSRALPSRIPSPSFNPVESSNGIKPISRAKGGSRGPSKPPPPNEDSVTEEELEEEDPEVTGGKSKNVVYDHRRAGVGDSSPAPSVPSKRVSPDSSPPPKSRNSPRQPSAPASSSPLPLPAKRAKAAESSSDEGDSEEERKKRLARLKGTMNANRGAKQPLKRAGKRF